MYNNILIPVLLDEGHDNKHTFDLAKTFAGSDAKFTIVHVVEPIPSFVLSEIPEEVLRSTRANIEASVARLTRDLPGAVGKVISGHAGKAIVDYAKDNDIDCIIIASHRPGFGDYFLGSTAARVVRHAECSVHVIR